MLLSHGADVTIATKDGLNVISVITGSDALGKLQKDQIKDIIFKSFDPLELRRTNTVRAKLALLRKMEIAAFQDHEKSEDVPLLKRGPAQKPTYYEKLDDVTTGISTS